MKQILYIVARNLAIALLVLVALISTTHYYSNRTETLNERSIVKVLNAEGTGGGTGWVARSGNKKVIVTNDHVCAVQSDGYVRIESETGPSIKKVLKRNFSRDLCLVEGIDAPALTIADHGPSRFDRVKVLGHPGLRPTAPASGSYTGPGIVQIGFHPKEDGKCPEGSNTVESMFGTFCVLSMELGYTTVPIMPGNSGSPITNSSGEVIGVINSADSNGNQGMFVPLNYLKEMLGD